MNEIEYEIREQDLLAFNEHQLKHSEKLQKTLNRHQATIPGIMVLIALFLWFYYQDTLSAIWVGLGAAIWGVAVPWYLRWNARSQIRKMYTADVKDAVLGRYKLRIEPNALVEVSKAGESRIKWSEILRIEKTKGYAFVFVDVDSALILPLATMKKGDLVEFVKEADQRVEAAA